MTILHLAARARRCSFACFAAFSIAGAGAGELPGDSIYHLQAPLTDQDGHALRLDFARGRPVLVSMFYTSCPMACPLIISTVQQSVLALPEEERARVRVLMVSFDPERDTVTRLKQTALEHDCDAHWTLARATGDDARQIAALLSIQYRRLNDGDFNHASVISLLDAQGRIVARTSMLGAVDPGLLKALRAELER